MTKAKTVKIKYSEMEIEGLVMPNGEYRIAVSQTAKLLFPDNLNHATKHVKANLKGGVELIKTMSDLNRKEVNTISLEEFRSLCLVVYSKTPKKSYFDVLYCVTGFLGHDVTGLEALYLHNKRKKPRKSAQDEKQIQLAYHARHGGEMEVNTPLGRIDLLTSTTLYEFKHISKYKEALGQVICYSTYAPRANKVIVLFGCKSKQTQAIFDFQNICKDYGIKVVKLS